MTASSKELLDIQATIQCEFTLKRIHDMIRTYSQMHRTDKYSQRSSIFLPVWLNAWVFVYELSGCGFQSSCSQDNDIDKNNNNSPQDYHSSEIIKCRVGVGRGIFCLLGGKNFSALDSSLCRDDVSIKILVVV